MTISLVVELPETVYVELIHYLNQDNTLDIDKAVTAAISDYVITNRIKVQDQCLLRPQEGRE
jgi:hypothetical protein